MELTVQIPDDLARSLNESGGDLSRRVVEALAIEEYRSGRLTKPQLRQTLGIESSYELDGFFKSHHVWIDYDEHEAAEEQAGLDALAKSSDEPLLFKGSDFNKTDLKIA